MSSKRARPYDEPPSPESSAEEEEEEDEVEEEEEEEEEEEQQQIPLPTASKKPPSDDEEDEEEEEDEDSDDDDVKNPALTPKTPTTELKKQVPESKSDSDTESDSDTDATRKAANYTIKPVNKDSPASKPKSYPSSSSVAKVVALKAVKKSVEEEEDGAEKKGFITRLWGFNDEIAALQGMIDFKNQHNKDALTNQDDFYNFIRTKLSNPKFTKLQVIDKLRRLKKKFKNNLNKSEISHPPHEVKSFQLSKIIWGDDDKAVNNDNVNNNNNNNHVKKSAKKAKVSEKVTRVEGDMMEVDDENERKAVKDELMGEETRFEQLYPHLMKAFEGESIPKVPLLDGFKGYLTKVDSLQLEDWDRKWKEVRLAETNAYISKLALIQEQTSWFCNAMKSAN